MYTPSPHIHTLPTQSPPPPHTHRATLLKIEEEWIQQACSTIAEFKPDLVITEKGLSDLATHYLTKAGISAIRRLRKTDNNRIARACGATIVNRIDEVGGGYGVSVVVWCVFCVWCVCNRCICADRSPPKHLLWCFAYMFHMNYDHHVPTKTHKYRSTCSHAPPHDIP